MDLNDQPEQHDSPALALYGIAIRQPSDLIYAAIRAMHGEELFRLAATGEERRCCRCGAVIDTDNRGWSSAQTLLLDGHFAGFVYLLHCTDCPPEKLVGEIRAVGTWPQETDEWKFANGKL